MYNVKLQSNSRLICDKKTPPHFFTGGAFYFIHLFFDVQNDKQINNEISFPHLS